MLKNLNLKRTGICLFVVLGLSFSFSMSYAIENTSAPQKTKFSLFKKNKNEVKLKKVKKAKVTEVELPQVASFKTHPSEMQTLSLQDCVKYAIEHNPYLAVSEQQIKASEAGIGKAR